MFARKTDEKTRKKVIELEEEFKALETRLMARVNTLEESVLGLAYEQKRNDGFFSMLISTIQEWRDKDE